MNRRITLGAVAAVVVVLVTWYMLMWSPASRRLSAERLAVSSHQAQISALDAQVASLRAQARKLPQQEAKLSIVEKAVPQKVAVSAVVDQIAALATHSGVAWTDESQAVQPPAPAATTSTKNKGAKSLVAPPRVVDLTLTVKGSYSQVTTFLAGIGRIPRLAVVDGLDISGGASKSSGPAHAVPLTVTLQGKIFYDPSALPKAPAVRG